jgi:hypothetical protein
LSLVAPHQLTQPIVNLIKLLRINGRALSNRRYLSLVTTALAKTKIKVIGVATRGASDRRDEKLGHLRKVLQMNK